MVVVSQKLGKSVSYPPSLKPGPCGVWIHYAIHLTTGASSHLLDSIIKWHLVIHDLITGGWCNRPFAELISEIQFGRKFGNPRGVLWWLTAHDRNSLRSWSYYRSLPRIYWWRRSWRGIWLLVVYAHVYFEMIEY